MKLKTRGKARGVARRINLVIERMGLKDKVKYLGMEENRLYLERLDIE